MELKLQMVSSVADDAIRACEEWRERLVKSEKSGRISAAALSSVLVLVGSAIVILISDVTPLRLTDFLMQSGSTTYFAVVGPVSVGTGLLYYVISRHRPSAYSNLSDLIQRSKAENRTRPNAILMLTEQMVTRVLPQAKHDKFDSAIAYGILAFFLTAFIFPLNLPIATVVWVYFRYEAEAEFNRETTRFSNWKMRLQA